MRKGANGIMKILIVDDHPGMRAILAELLREMGEYEPIEAPNGEAALRLVPHHQPEVAVVDMRLPGMDGIQTAARLREISPDLRVIICTADPSLAIGRETGDLTICDKSEMPGSLLEALQTVGQT